MITAELSDPGNTLPGAEAPGLHPSAIGQDGLAVHWASTASEVVAWNPRLAYAFEKHGIAYCCEDCTSLEEICAGRGICRESLFADFRAASSRQTFATGSIDWSTRPAAEVMGHLVEAYHAYLETELLRHPRLLDHLLTRHRNEFLNLWELSRLVNEFNTALKNHLFRERQAFGVPGAGLSGPAGNPRPEQAGLAALVQDLCGEHLYFTDALAQMQLLTNGFSASGSSCNTYRVLAGSLRCIGVVLCRSMAEEETSLFPRMVSASRRAG